MKEARDRTLSFQSYEIMTLTQFKYLISVVDNKLNISKAAEFSNTSQPGISKQVKLLEDELGAHLFIRKGKKIESLTPLGERVTTYARKILQDVENIKVIGNQISKVDGDEFKRRRCE